MLNTNLLPKEEKRLIWFEEVRRIIVFFTILTAVVFIVGSAFLLPSYFVFFLQQREFERLIKVEAEASQGLRVSDILLAAKKVNSAMVVLKEFLSGPQKATALFENLLEAVTPFIVIAGIEVKNNGEATLTGIAPTRSVLLNFEKRLRDSGLFQEISFPISNIIREANIDFVMRGKIKPRYGL